MKIIPSIPQETDDVTSDFDNIVENAKDCGMLFILLLGVRIQFEKRQVLIDNSSFCGG